MTNTINPTHRATILAAADILNNQIQEEKIDELSYSLEVRNAVIAWNGLNTILSRISAVNDNGDEDFADLAVCIDILNGSPLFKYSKNMGKKVKTPLQILLKLHASRFEDKKSDEFVNLLDTVIVDKDYSPPGKSTTSEPTKSQRSPVNETEENFAELLDVYS